MTAPTATVWRAPSGRLHSKRGCSGSRNRDSVAIRITEDEFKRALANYAVCRCLRWAPPEFRPAEEEK